MGYKTKSEINTTWPYKRKAKKENECKQDKKEKRKQKACMKENIRRESTRDHGVKEEEKKN